MRTFFLFFFQLLLASASTAQCTEEVNIFPGQEFPPINLCSLGDSPVTITASPAGGTFSGPGIVGNQFDPTLAGEGTHVITYTVTLPCGTISGQQEFFVDDCCPIFGYSIQQIDDCDDPFDPNSTRLVEISVGYQKNEFSSNFVSISGDLIPTTSRSVTIDPPLVVQFEVPNTDDVYVFNIVDADGRCTPRIFGLEGGCGCEVEIGIIEISLGGIPICSGDTYQVTVHYRSNTPLFVSLDGGQTTEPGLVLPATDASGSTYTLDIDAGGDPTDFVLISTEDQNCRAERLLGFPISGGIQPTCKNPVIVYLDENGQAELDPLDVLSTEVPELCPEWELSLDNNQFDCDDVGSSTLSVELTITDPTGNYSSGSCTSPVEVFDTIPPSLTCNDITVNFNGESTIEVSYGELFTATDNCPLLITPLPIETISCEQVGTTIVRLIEYDDENGNVAECNATITVGGLPCGFSTCQEDIGCPDSFADFDAASETFSLTGVDCFYGNPFNNDELLFVKAAFCGNGEIIARLDDVSGTTFGWGGISLRESCEPGAKKMQIVHNGGYFIRREVRTATNGPAYPQQFPTFDKRWMKIVRTGHQFVAYVSTNGIQWQFIGAQNIIMPTCIEAGLVVTNYTPVSEVTGLFSNVQINSTAFLTQPDLGDVAIGQTDDQILDDLEDHQHLEVYPNPTQGNLTLSYQQLKPDSQVEIINQFGQKVASHQLPGEEGQTQISLADLPKGLYFLRFPSPQGELLVKRVVLQ